MKILRGWKLFEMDSKGRLFPLFIGKKEETPKNEWIMAQIIMDHKGFAHRPGWHIGTGIPSAPWLMSANGTYKSPRGKRFKRVWCEVEWAADVDYTHIVEKLPRKCFVDRLPDGGFYKFKESGNRLWVIADRIKVTRIISEDERLHILSMMNYDEQKAFEPYRQAMAKRMQAV